MSGVIGEQTPVAKPARTGDDGLFLLSLDGGGVRGLSSLLVLKQIMEAIDPQNPPRPCDYFDMIGGTSTGGLIAIMLGRMRLTVDECIMAYSELAPDAFTKVHHRIKLRNGETQGRFDHVALEKGIKSLLKTYGMDPESLLKEPEEDSSCKVFVCATAQNACRPVILSSYYNARRGNHWLSKGKIWEAARATSAATTFFDPITIDGETFVDGATGANNPVNELWSEAGDIWGDGGGLDPSKVQSLVSIGTGTPASVAFGPDVAGLSRALKAISTETEMTASTFQKHHSKLFQAGRAFRFSVVAGLEHVGLHEVEKWDEIKASTNAYMQAEDTFIKLRQCALMLKERQWARQLAEDSIRFAQPSVQYLNDPENHIEGDELRWLTHTKVYQRWASDRARSSVLWCRTGHDNGPSSRDSVAASLARLQAVPGPHNVTSTPRILYFQCQSQPLGRFEDRETEQQPISGSHVLVSLVCQGFLLDSVRVDDIAARLWTLTPSQREELRASIACPNVASLSDLSGLLRLQIDAGMNRPQCIAIDNIHCISELGLEDLLHHLWSLFDQGYQPSSGTVAIILSGLPTRRSETVLAHTHLFEIDDKTEYHECLDSLHFRDWNTRREQVDSPEEGTNQWIWSHAQYEAWYASHHGILWVEGKPGSGKSVLAGSLQRRVMASWEQSDPSVSNTPQNPTGATSPRSIVAGWFYSTRLGSVGKSHLSLFRSIIYQLLSQDPSLFSIVVEYYREFPINASRKWDSEGPTASKPERLSESWCESTEFEATAKKILDRISATGTSIICVVDAMDEAEPDLNSAFRTPAPRRGSRISTILGALSSLVVGTVGSRMKFVFLSRPEPLLELDFLRAQRKLESTFRITLEHENRSDIEVLVDRGIDSLKAAIHTYDSDSDDGVLGPKRVHMAPRLAHQALRQIQNSEAETLRRIHEYILEHAQGVVLWVTLILEDLQQIAAGGMVTFLELESRLRSLPLELNDLYDRIIHDLSSKLTSRELSRSRDIFLLVAGAGSFGRPLSLQELRDALAVPSDVAAALTSQVDPIVANRPIIRSWPDFRRQLARHCGTLIEVVKPGDIAGNLRRDGLQPDDVVQFIHRTVKDFLQQRPNVDIFHIAEDNAGLFVKQLSMRYLAIAFPRTNTPYWTRFKATKDSSWKDNVAGFVEYMDQRILFPFAVEVLSDPVGPQQLQVLTDIGFDGTVLDDMIDPPAAEWNESDVRNTLSDEAGFYDRASVRAVLLGYAVYHACLNGCVTATRNLASLYTVFGTDDQDYTLDYVDVMRNGALRAAIQRGLEKETVLFMNDFRPLRFNVVRLYSFRDLARHTGNLSILDILRRGNTFDEARFGRQGLIQVAQPGLGAARESEPGDAAWRPEASAESEPPDTSGSPDPDYNLLYLQIQAQKAIKVICELRSAIDGDTGLREIASDTDMESEE